MGHYRHVTSSDRHVLFGSRWGEVLLLDRRTLRSYFNQSGENSDGLSEEDDLEAAMAAGTFDAIASDMIACGGSVEELPPSVKDWLDANPVKQEPPHG